MTNYLPKGSMVTGAYYANELCELHEALKSKRRGKLRRGVLLLHDNAPAHTSGTATSTAAECGYKLLPHPPYSPDLASSDFCLFPLLKQHQHGGQYESDDDVIIQSVEDFLHEQDELFYQTGIQKLQKRWIKFTEIM